MRVGGWFLLSGGPKDTSKSRIASGQDFGGERFSTSLSWAEDLLYAAVDGVGDMSLILGVFGTVASLGWKPEMSWDYLGLNLGRHYPKGRHWAQPDLLRSPPPDLPRSHRVTTLPPSGIAAHLHALATISNQFCWVLLAQHHRFQQ